MRLLPRSRARRVAILVAGVAAIGTATWLGLSWSGTYRQAEAFRSDLAALRDAVTAQDWAVVADQVPRALQSAREMESSTRQPQWRLLEDVPGIGASASAVTELSVSTSALLSAAEPLTSYAKRIVSGQVRRDDGSVDLESVQEVAPLLDRLSDVLDQEAARLERIDATAVRPEIAGPLVDLRERLRAAQPTVNTAAEMATRLPSLLGAEGDRTWLVLLQNPAEARGTGGFPGAYVTMTARDGALAVAATGKSGELNEIGIPRGVGPEDSQLLWGDFLTQWNTFNLSPHFPLTGELAAAGMAARGERVDGVLAVDPRTVAAMLAVTGPVTAGGVTLTSDNAERFFTIDSYADLPDQTRRDEVTLELVGAVLEAFLAGSWDPVVLADALREPIADGRILVWSAKPDEEEWLVDTPVGGSVPDSRGSVIAVAFNNAAGNKMDAFVATSVDYRPGRCATAAIQQSQVSVTLRNDAPPDLPLESGNYGRADDPAAPEGSTKLLVHIYAPVGATYVTSTIDGEPAVLYAGEERARPVWWTYITLERGQESVIEVAFEEPTVLGVEPAVLPQGMVIDEMTSVRPNTAC